MRKILPFIVLLIALTLGTNALALRIGNELISEGDLKHEVLLKIGEPYSREVIGYIDRVQSEERIRVMKIEEWIVAVTQYGTTYYYSLVFEGNVLKEIKSAGQKN